MSINKDTIMKAKELASKYTPETLSVERLRLMMLIPSVRAKIEACRRAGYSDEEILKELEGTL